MDYTLNDFQNDCLRTTNRKLDWKDTVTNCILGASGEVAEISEHFKKHWYHGHELDLNKIIVEIGDVMFYLAWLSDTLGFELEGVAEAVIKKLKKRYGETFNEELSINRKND